MHKHVNLVDLVNLKSFLTSFSYLLVLSNVGFDTAENELSKVCRYQTIPPPLGHKFRSDNPYCGISRTKPDSSPSGSGEGTSTLMDLRIGEDFLKCEQRIVASLHGELCKYLSKCFLESILNWDLRHRWRFFTLG